LDHGIEAKQALFENCSRTVQFIHFPKEFGTEGKTFDGLVSTIYVAPTMFDFDGIDSYYALDGQSWKNAIDDPAEEKSWKEDRCLVFENQFDRAVRCGGCGKLVAMRGLTSGADDVST
jgi:arylsulfatase A-like enzyme